MQFLTLWTSLNYGSLRFNYSISIQYRLTACIWARKKHRWLLTDVFGQPSSRLSCTRFENGVEGFSRCERFQRKRRKLSTSLTLLNEAVDILRSPCTSTDHLQQLPAHRSVGSVQVPATSERGELREMARLFPFHSQGASAGKISSRQPFERFRPSASSSGPKKVLNQGKPGLARSSAYVNQTSW